MSICCQKKVHFKLERHNDILETLKLFLEYYCTRQNSVRTTNQTYVSAKEVKSYTYCCNVRYANRFSLHRWYGSLKRSQVHKKIPNIAICSFKPFETPQQAVYSYKICYFPDFYQMLFKSQGESNKNKFWNWKCWSVYHFFWLSVLHTLKNGYHNSFYFFLNLIIFEHKQTFSDCNPDKLSKQKIWVAIALLPIFTPPPKKKKKKNKKISVGL